MGMRGSALRRLIGPILACRTGMPTADGKAYLGNEEAGLHLADMPGRRSGQARIRAVRELPDWLVADRRGGWG